MYAVEKNVPIPKHDRRRQCKYPWKELGVGDSFYVPNGNRNSLYAGARNWAKKLNHKYVCRTEGRGMRVWRSA